MAIEQVVTAPRSPWQNAYVERIIGSIHRECLDHIIVSGERHLRRVLSTYFEYHHRSRTHLSLGKDCPEPRSAQPPSTGNETFTRHSLVRRVLLTEGVTFLASAAGAYWLTDAIASYLCHDKARGEAFQVWSLNVNVQSRTSSIASR